MKSKTKLKEELRLKREAEAKKKEETKIIHHANSSGTFSTSVDGEEIGLGEEKEE